MILRFDFLRVSVDERVNNPSPNLCYYLRWMKVPRLPEGRLASNHRTHEREIAVVLWHLQFTVRISRRACTMNFKLMQSIVSPLAEETPGALVNTQTPRLSPGHNQGRSE
jgi:hypothetical protein